MKNFFQKSHNPKVDPRSQKFTDAVMTMLESNGMADKNQRGKCAHTLFQATLKFYRGLQKLTPDQMDGSVEIHANEMKAILASFGITEQATQETIIVDYFATLNTLGMS